MWEAIYKAYEKVKVDIKRRILKKKPLPTYLSSLKRYDIHLNCLLGSLYVLYILFLESIHPIMICNIHCMFCTSIYILKILPSEQ